MSATNVVYVVSNISPLEIVWNAHFHPAPWTCAYCGYGHATEVLMCEELHDGEPCGHAKPYGLGAGGNGSGYLLTTTSAHSPDAAATLAGARGPSDVVTIQLAAEQDAARVLVEVGAP